MKILYSSRWLLFGCILCFVFTGYFGELKAQEVPPSDEVILKEKISNCPYLKGIFKEEDKWLFSEKDDWIYANLAKGPKTFVFGYKKAKIQEWGKHLPRWYLAIGSMELGIVIASFKGVVKDEKYLINSISTISKNCPFPDIQASLDYNEVIEQISVDTNCDHFFDKIYNVRIKSEADYHKEEPYTQEAKILLDNIDRLRTRSW